MTPFNQLAPSWMRSLQADLGLTPAQAAGIMGNLGFESGGFEELHELGQPEGQGGYGAAQWTGSRRVQFMAWCNSRGLAWTSDEANYGFLIHELTTSHAGSLVHLKKTTTIQSATFTFGYWFEAPAGTTETHLPGYAERLAYAKRALAAPAAGPAPAPDSEPAISAIDRIKAIQVILGVHPDGSFGPISEAALTALRPKRGGAT
jgi:hypothetical protein